MVKTVIPRLYKDTYIRIPEGGSGEDNAGSGG